MINVENFKKLSKEEIFDTLKNVNEYWINKFYFNKTVINPFELDEFLNKIYKKSNLPVPNVYYDICFDDTPNFSGEKNTDTEVNNVFEKWFEGILLNIYEKSRIIK
jgi:hypothetical protein